MEYRTLIKKLELPAGHAAPTELRYEDLVARTLTRSDLREDVEGINADIELIQRTRGGGWPTEPATEELNFQDLVWHELEFREGYSFAYVLRDAEGTYLGCCYLYPLGRRTELSENLLGCDLDDSWWVTPSAYERGYYAKAYLALQHWIASEFPPWKAHFSNAEIPD